MGDVEGEATAALWALQCVLMEVRVWDIDRASPVPLAAAVEAVRQLDEAERRVRAARAVLREQMADAQRSAPNAP
jgi:hypothetical protein